MSQSETHLVTLALLLVIFGAGAGAALAQTKAYVTTAGPSVTVIDTATNTISGSVLVGSKTDGVAVTPNAAFVYVAVPWSERHKDQHRLFLVFTFGRGWR